MSSTLNHRLIALALTIATILVTAVWTVGDATERPIPAASPQLAPPPTSTPFGQAVLATLTEQDLPPGCVQPTRHLTLYAFELEREGDEIRLGYGVTRASASYPGPTIEMIEGECLAITVVNEIPAATLAELRDHPRLGLLEPDPDFPLGVSLHVHGVKYTAASDGTLHSGSWVAPGEARTYVWYAEPAGVAPDGRITSHGTAGYWWYHDHVVGTDHGTGGIGSGLFGALVVRRPGDPVPAYTYVLAMSDDASINLRTHPETDACDEVEPRPSATCLVARDGELVEFVVFGIGNDFHTFHLHGHTWVDNRNGVLAPTDAQTRVVDVVSLGPSASFGFQVTAGAGVGTGHWMIHCHVQRHSDLGMSTFLHVLPADSPLAPPGSIDSHDDAELAPVADLHAGARFRGAAAPTTGSTDRPTLGYYCQLPLTGSTEAVRRPAPVGPTRGSAAPPARDGSRARWETVRA